MNRCGSDAVAVVRKAAEGFALNVFDESVLKTLCQYVVCRYNFYIDLCRHSPYIQPNLALPTLTH